MSRLGKLFRTAAAAALGVAASPVTAQAESSGPATLPVLNPAPYATPGASATARLTSPAASPAYRQAPCQPAPCCPTTPGSPYTMPYGGPGGMAGGPGGDSGVGGGETATPSFGSQMAGAGLGQTSSLGAYIDNAAPVSMFRLRYDSMYDNNRPDRAEYFYAKSGYFRLAVPPQLNARGPAYVVPPPGQPGLTKIDAQEINSYFELALAQRLSVFASVPVRFINPNLGASSASLSDIWFGAKYAFIYTPQRIVTFQLRAIAPSGQPVLGTGTGNWWLEPGLLYLEQLSCKWQLFGQLKYQMHLSRQSDFTGNVFTYGLGTSYIVANGSWGYVAPVGEFVGWTVLGGRESILEPILVDPNTASRSATGDTIVNAKFGVRVGFGQSQPGQPYPTRSDFYFGYARAVTGAVWYKDMFRLEYRLRF